MQRLVTARVLTRLCTACCLRTRQRCLESGMRRRGCKATFGLMSRFVGSPVYRHPGWHRRLPQLRHSHELFVSLYSVASPERRFVAGDKEFAVDEHSLAAENVSRYDLLPAWARLELAGCARVRLTCGYHNYVVPIPLGTLQFVAVIVYALRLVCPALLRSCSSCSMSS